MDELVAAHLVGYFTQTDDVVIATSLKAGGEVRTEIWGVVVDGECYIRNGFGDSSKWYRRAQRTHHAVFCDGDRRYPVSIEDVADAATLRAVDAAYKRKYRGPGVRAVVSSNSRRYTMRVVPRAEIAAAP